MKHLFKKTNPRVISKEVKEDRRQLDSANTATKSKLSDQFNANIASRRQPELKKYSDFILNFFSNIPGSKENVELDVSKGSSSSAQWNKFTKQIQVNEDHLMNSIKQWSPETPKNSSLQDSKYDLSNFQIDGVDQTIPEYQKEYPHHDYGPSENLEFIETLAHEKGHGLQHWINNFQGKLENPPEIYGTKQEIYAADKYYMLKQLIADAKSIGKYNTDYREATSGRRVDKNDENRRAESGYGMSEKFADLIGGYLSNTRFNTNPNETIDNNWGRPASNPNNLSGQQEIPHFFKVLRDLQEYNAKQRTGELPMDKMRLKEHYDFSDKYKDDPGNIKLKKYPY